MELKKRICPQCGAAIPPGEAVCPYCRSSSYGPEAEQAYMQKLETLRSDLDQVGEAGKTASRKEIGRVGRRIFFVCLLILGIAAVSAVFFISLNKKENDRNRREYAWRQEALPELDLLFDEAEYEALLDAYQSARKEGHDVYRWKHSGFCEIYEGIGYADAALEYRGKGTFGRDDAILLLNDVLKFRGIRHRSDIPSKDRELLEPMLAHFEGVLTEVFGASMEEIEEFDRILRQNGGYPSYDSCSKFVDRHPEILLGKK